MLGHPAEGQQRLCSGDGRCARGLHAPRDPDRPLVCLDETSKKLVAETRVPIPMKPGRAARVDYEYEPNGTANLFMLFAPRSEEHTSELQSHLNLVCRLLLEKKKNELQNYI